MPVKLSSTGGGSVTLTTPSTASDFTFTVPALTGTAIIANASGNVGIGTSSPSAKLEVSDGTVRINTSPLSAIGYFGTVSNHPLGFITNNVEGMRLDTSSNLYINSGYGSIAITYGCRAWVNFNGTGTVAIRASGNVSSITDNGTGTYTVNFATAMPDTNYSVTGTCSNNDNNRNESGTLSYGSSGTYSTTAVQVWTVENTGSVTVDIDSARISVAIFR